MSESHLDWLDEFLGSMPVIGDARRSIFDIAYLSHRETTISNLLAYFLDPDENHGLSEVFLRSLLEALPPKCESERRTLERSLSEYSVEREYPTRKGGRLDIVLKSCQSGVSSNGCRDGEADEGTSDWAILIENKLNAPLKNDLEDYWNSVKANCKVGIVLSLRSHGLDDSEFNNILHGTFASMIRANLSEYFLNLDGRHLFLLQEFLFSLLRIGSGMEEKAMQDYGKMLRLFRSKRIEIDRLFVEDGKLHVHVSSQIAEAFEGFDFGESPERNSAKSRHFYQPKGSTSQRERMLRFWIPIDQFKNDGVLRGAFELYGDETRYAGLLKSGLMEKSVFTTRVKEGKGGKQGGAYCHLFWFDIPSFRANEESEETVKDCVSRLLRDHLMGDDGPIKTAIRLYDDIVSKHLISQL